MDSLVDSLISTAFYAALLDSWRRTASELREHSSWSAARTRHCLQKHAHGHHRTIGNCYSGDCWLCNFEQLEDGERQKENQIVPFLYKLNRAYSEWLISTSKQPTDDQSSRGAADQLQRGKRHGGLSQRSRYVVLKELLRRWKSFCAQVSSLERKLSTHWRNELPLRKCVLAMSMGDKSPSSCMNQVAAGQVINDFDRCTSSELLRGGPTYSGKDRNQVLSSRGCSALDYQSASWRRA